MTRSNESGAGGMTGATGDLTPDDADEPFIPAEQRLISNPDPDHSRPDDEPPLAGGTTPDESDGDEFSDKDDRF
jgi:hypothetical protein